MLTSPKPQDSDFHSEYLKKPERFKDLPNDRLCCAKSVSLFSEWPEAKKVRFFQKKKHYTHAGMVELRPDCGKIDSSQTTSHMDWWPLKKTPVVGLVKRIRAL